MQKFVLRKSINSFSIKLGASSIVEVIVALAICMIIFLIAMSVIVNSQRSNNIRLKQKAQFLLSTMPANIREQDSIAGSGALKLETIEQKNDSIYGVNTVSYRVMDQAGHVLAMKVMWLPTDSVKSEEIDN